MGKKSVAGRESGPPNSRKHKAFVPPRAQGSSSGPQPRWSSKAEPTPGASSLVAYGGTSTYKTPSSAGTSKQGKQATSSVSKKPDPFPIEKRKLPNGEVEYAPKGNETEAQKPEANKAEKKPEGKKEREWYRQKFYKK